MQRCGVLAECSEEEGRLTRPFASNSMHRAHEHVTAWMREAGMAVRTDNVGNLRGRYEGTVPGPVLRASGVKWDLRKAQPYANYKNFDFEIPVGQNGDTYDRYLVRMAEMRQSLRIIQQAVDALPEGPIMAKVPKVMKPPVGEVYHSIEAPKGELGYFIVSDGSTQPYRLRVRPPSFVNLQALDKMCRGQLVADVIAVIGTLDIVLGEVDR